MKSIGLICLGEPLIAFIPQVRTSFRRSTSVERFTVGAEVNVAVAAARMGCPSSIVGFVGDDLGAEAIYDDLAREGVSTEYLVRRPGAFTGAIIREVGPAGTARVSYLRSGSAGSQVDPKSLSKIDFSHFSFAHVSGVTPALSPSAREAAHSFIQEAKREGLQTSFDLNYRSRLWPASEAASVLRGFASEVDFVFGGVDEYALAFHTQDPINAAIELTKGSAQMVVLTSGAKRVTLVINGETESIDVGAVPVVDAVGAGDALVGVTLAGLAQGTPAIEALTQGIFAGGSVVSSLGDWNGLPWLSDMRDAPHMETGEVDR